METELCLTMSQESIHALAVRIHNLARVLSLYPIVKLSVFLLSREG